MNLPILVLARKYVFILVEQKNKNKTNHGTKKRIGKCIAYQTQKNVQGYNNPLFYIIHTCFVTTLLFVKSVLFPTNTDTTPFGAFSDTCCIHVETFSNDSLFVTS